MRRLAAAAVLAMVVSSAPAAARAEGLRRPRFFEMRLALGGGQSDVDFAQGQYVRDTKTGKIGVDFQPASSGRGFTGGFGMTLGYSSWSESSATSGSGFLAALRANVGYFVPDAFAEVGAALRLGYSVMFDGAIHDSLHNTDPYFDEWGPFALGRLDARRWSVEAEAGGLQRGSHVAGRARYYPASSWAVGVELSRMERGVACSPSFGCPDVPAPIFGRTIVEGFVFIELVSLRDN